MRKAVFALLLFATPSAAAEPWDAAVRRLCSSLTQADCWIKSGAPVCDREQLACKNLEDHTPVIVIGKNGKRWHIKTLAGDGWINERWIMIDGSKMR